MFIYDYVVFWFYLCYDSYRFDFQPGQGGVYVTMKSDTKSRYLQSMDLYLSIENVCITLRIIPWRNSLFTQEAANWNIYWCQINTIIPKYGNQGIAWPRLAQTYTYTYTIKTILLGQCWPSTTVCISKIKKIYLNNVSFINKQISTQVLTSLFVLYTTPSFYTIKEIKIVK